MMKILVTAFDPFGGEELNPALEAVKNLEVEMEGVELFKLEVPTVFNDSIDRVIAEIERISPDKILMVGQAGGRFDITPERLAINLDDARIPDNKGNQPIDRRIVERGENAYFSTLPVKAIVREIRAMGLPASLSNTAGTFVCNHLMYGVLHHIVVNGLDIKAGFIHVPFIPAQAASKTPSQPSLGLDDIVRGLKGALRAIVIYDEDLTEVMGEIH